MIIGHYANGLREPGGIPTYVSRLSAGQRAAGHRVIAFEAAPHAGAPCDGEHYVAAPDVETLYAEAGRLGVDILHLHTFVPALPRNGLCVVRTVHDHEAYCLSGSQYLKRSGKPCGRSYSLLPCLGQHVVERCGGLRPAALRERFTILDTDRKLLPQLQLIVVSGYLRQRMLDFGYPAKRLTTLLPMAPDINTAAEPLADGIPRFVFAGRLSPEKGVQWLLQAAAQTRETLAVDICGSGFHAGQIAALSEQLGLTGKVKLHGWQRPDEITAHIRRARAAVFPSLWPEPAGQVALEAMAEARPVIAANGGGIPEIVANGRSGITVAPGDVAALASAMDTLAREPERASAMGREGLRIAAQDFGLDKHLATVMAVYARAMA